MIQFKGTSGVAIHRGVCKIMGKMVHVEAGNLPRIKVPQKMVSRIEKLSKRIELEKARVKRRSVKYKSPLVISCKRSEYNHHKGQTYSDFNPQTLASHGWKHRRSVGDYFSLMPHGSNPALLSTGREAAGWAGLSPTLLAGLKDMKIETPTNIQRRAIPEILRGNNVICAAETGSGKTLAYLLPLMELVQRQHRLGLALPPKSPKAVILVPARELVDQIVETAKKLSGHLGLNSYSVFELRRAMSMVADPASKHLDLLVSTPAVLGKILQSGEVSPSNLQHIVLDEADTLLDDSFNTEIKHILRRICAQGGAPTGNEVFVTTGIQVALVSATLPRSLDTTIGDLIPVDTFTRVTTDSLHHLMPHVRQTFFRLLSSQKTEEVVKQAKKSASGRVPTMIFCNKSSTCTWLGHVLQENGLDNTVLNGQLTGKERSERLEKFRDGASDLMVCTDIGSRGLDTIGVEKIINFDFPLFLSDYIHRAGRVGRVGSRDNCTVISLVTHKWDVDLLWQIEIASRKSKELHNVNANIKRKLFSVGMNKHPYSSSGV